MEQYNFQLLLYFVYFIRTIFFQHVFFQSMFLRLNKRQKKIASLHIFHFSTEQKNRPKISANKK
jgi:hypothetical protein